MSTGHNIFRDKLRVRLKQPLPGLEAQMKMVPGSRRREVMTRGNGYEAKKAAVLACFYPEDDGEIHIVLIRRNEYDGVHSGQISFPGGKLEDHDPDLVHTALREAEEETNILISQVEVLGEITDIYIPPSNFLVKAVVGWSPFRPDLIPDPSEVSEILTVPLKELTNPESRQHSEILRRDQTRNSVPCFIIGGNVIWGATAMLLSELVELVDDVKP